MREDITAREKQLYYPTNKRYLQKGRITLIRLIEKIELLDVPFPRSCETLPT